MLHHFQGAIYSIYVNKDGFATGSKDGSVKLWDAGFQPVTQLEISKTAAGYKGEREMKDAARCGLVPSSCSLNHRQTDRQTDRQIANSRLIPRFGMSRQAIV